MQSCNPFQREQASLRWAAIQTFVATSPSPYSPGLMKRVLPAASWKELVSARSAPNATPLPQGLALQTASLHAWLHGAAGAASSAAMHTCQRWMAALECQAHQSSHAMEVQLLYECILLELLGQLGICTVFWLLLLASQSSAGLE